MRQIFSILIIFLIIISKNNNYQKTTYINTHLSESFRPTPIYGFNGELSRGPSLNKIEYFDSIASLQMKAIRYPGGGISSFWDWEKNKGVSSKNGIITPSHYLSMSSDIQGLAELVKLVNTTKCEVIFTLNMITKTLENQISFLKQAEKLGLKIEYIELGNEHNLKNNPGRKQMKSANNYANTSQNWINKIKKEFPDCKIAMVGGNQNYSEDVRNWNTTVLNIPNEPDALAFHLYPSPNSILKNKNINFENLHKVLKKQIESQGISTLKPNIKIWITEYNIYWAGKNYEKQLKEKAEQNNLMLEWPQVLATSLMTIQLSMIPNVEILLNQSLSNWIGFAAINNKTFEKTPNGIAMEIFNKASSQSNYFRKIIFKKEENEVEDFHLIGLKFQTMKNAKILILNLTETSKEIKLNNILNNKKYLLEYYTNGNNLLIKGSNDVNHTITKQNTKPVVSLPPLSLTLISEQ